MIACVSMDSARCAAILQNTAPIKIVQPLGLDLQPTITVAEIARTCASLMLF